MVNKVAAVAKIELIFDIFFIFRINILSQYDWQMLIYSLEIKSVK